jgi:hypothetical protein
MGKRDSSVGRDGAIRAFKSVKVVVVDKFPDKKAAD